MNAAFAPLDSCWICKARTLEQVDEARFDLTAYRHEDPDLAAYSGATVGLVRCTCCGFAQPDRIPALPGFFARMYNQRWAADWISREHRETTKDLIFRDVLDGLARRLPPHRRALLDIGSHAGRFLALAASRGWRVEGAEVNQRTADFAARASLCPVHRLPAEQVERLGRRFDAATLTDVLEHVPRPLDLLVTVRGVIRPGGWIAVKVPCGPMQRRKEHARAWLDRGYRPRLADNLVHVNHFSPRALKLALQKAGFDSLAIRAGAPERTASRMSNAARLALFRIARAAPFGVHSPAALNLQAFARVPDIPS